MKVLSGIVEARVVMGIVITFLNFYEFNIDLYRSIRTKLWSILKGCGKRGQGDQKVMMIRLVFEVENLLCGSYDRLEY